jgi:ATP-dependent Clp protease ATP-binding subunit ClpA
MRGLWRYFDLANPTYERLTDRARLVFALAEQFAHEQRAPAIEPEHILRGLASGGRGVGRTVLEEMGVDLFRLLPEIVELLPSYPERPRPPVEEMLAEGPRAIAKYFPDLDLGPGGAACLEAARSGAKGLDHNYLGTEHLVMGLVAVQSPASAFLRDRGIAAEPFREGVVRLLVGDGS